jgi:hypothetical protein
LRRWLGSHDGLPSPLLPLQLPQPLLLPLQLPLQLPLPLPLVDDGCNFSEPWQLQPQEVLCCRTKVER